MILKTSYKEIIKKNTFKHNFSHEVRQNFPILLTFALTVLFIGTIPKVLMLASYNPDVYPTTQPLTYQDYNFMLGVEGVVLYPFFAFILALIQFKNLSNKRATDVYASLPITRTDFFLSKITAGFAILFIPVFISNIIVMSANIIFIGFTEFLIYDFFYVFFLQIVLMLIPYALVSFISVLTGTIFENIIYPLVLYFSPILIFNLLITLFSSTLFGFVAMEGQVLVSRFISPHFAVITGDPTPLSDSHTYLTQFASITAQLTDANVTNFFSPLSEYLLIFSIWFMVCVILLVCGLKSFKKRNMENAGRPSVCKTLHTICCFITSFVSGIVLLLLNVYLNSSDYNFTSYVMFFLGSFLGFVIYQAVILQSIKLILKSLVKYGCFAVFFTVFVVALNTQLFGYYLRPVNVDDVKVVTIGNSNFVDFSALSDYFTLEEGKNYTTTTDEETIKATVDFINTSIDNHDKENLNYRSIKFIMTTDDGKRIIRQYCCKEENREEFYNLIDTMTRKADKIIDENVFASTFENPKEIIVSDIFMTNASKLDETQREKLDLKELGKALNQDIFEIGVSNLGNQDTQEVLVLTFLMNYQEDASAGGVVMGDGGIVPTKDFEVLTNSEFGNCYLNKIPIKANFKHTIAYLDSIGLMEYSKTDFDSIKSVTYTKTSGTEYSKYNLKNYDNFTNVGGTTPGFAFFKEIDYTMDIVYFKSEFQQENDIETTSDPEKIKSILQNCFIENTIIDGETKFAFVETKDDDANVYILK